MVSIFRCAPPSRPTSFEPYLLQDHSGRILSFDGQKIGINGSDRCGALPLEVVDVARRKDMVSGASHPVVDSKRSSKDDAAAYCREVCVAM